MRIRCLSGRALALVSLAAILAVHTVMATGAFSNGQAASVVLGQPGFTTNAASGTATASSVHFPSGVVADSAGNVWVADVLNSRVLQFKQPLTNGASASLVLGQPNLTSNQGNNGGRTANSLSAPNGLAIDASGNLWVADGGANGRVLRYSPPFTNFMAASLVLGPPDFTSSQTSILPVGIAFDSAGNLWVASEQSNRVVRFDAPFSNGKTASIVLGQASTAPTASSFDHPHSVAIDSAGNLWVADGGNNRVLEFSPPFANGQAASFVLGQSGFTSNTQVAPPTASSLRNPTGVRFDSNGDLWVVDNGNSRVIQFSPPFTSGQAASAVLGQGDFQSSAASAPPTASSLAGPWAIAFAGQQLWVADHDNNRVLGYAPATDGGGGRGGTIAKNPISPPDFPYKVTAETTCTESIGRLCLQWEFVKLCIGGNCFAPPSPGNPPCVKCLLGASLATGAVLGIVGAVFAMRRRRP